MARTAADEANDRAARNPELMLARDLDDALVDLGAGVRAPVVDATGIVWRLNRADARTVRDLLRRLDCLEADVMAIAQHRADAACCQHADDSAACPASAFLVAAYSITAGR